MLSNWSAVKAWYLLIFTHTVLSQTTATSSPSTSPTGNSAMTAVPSSSSFYPPYSASSFAPFATGNGDNAPNGNNNNNQNSGGLNTYYAVGLGLLMACIAVALYFIFQRRAREMASRRRNGGRTDALQRDVGVGYPAGDPARGQGYLPSTRGLQRSAEAPLEDGLNERGEAPPQYISKREWEELHPNDAGEYYGPGIPLQTLSRDHAGLKPPDYSESSTREVDRNARSSTASASSSGAVENRTNP